LNRDLRRTAGAVAAVLAVVGLIYLGPIYKAIGPAAVLWIYDVTVVVSAFVGAALALLLWRSFHRGEVLRRIFAFIGGGLLLWAGGETVWSFDQLVAGERLPYPSLADVAWLLGFAAMAAGLILRYRSLQMKPGRGWSFALFWLFAASATLIVILVTVPIVRQSDPAHLAEDVVNALYPIGDLAITIGALMLALLLTGGALSVPWSLIAAGLLCAAVSDLLYVYSLSQGTYLVDPAGGVNAITFASNVVYAASYLLADAGLFIQARVQRVI
jgi:hypothetical protein